MKLGIVGEYDSLRDTHNQTNAAISHSLNQLNADIEWNWISTEDVLTHKDQIFESYHGFWIAPGSPYKKMLGALEVIKHCRLNNIPLLGTCGGFQHIVIEYARNVLYIEDAEHAESNPEASHLIVSKLECSLVGKTLEINLDKKSRAFEICSTDKLVESYYCNFGLNLKYQSQLHDAGLRTVGTDDMKETRIVELSNHRFFIGTLFLPQMNSTKEQPHRIITEFLRKVME